MNNNRPRTIKMFHGRKLWIPYDEIKEDGTIVKMQKPVPAGGIRILNVSAKCSDSTASIAANLDGYIPKDGEWEPREAPVKVYSNTTVHKSIADKERSDQKKKDYRPSKRVQRRRRPARNKNSK